MQITINETQLSDIFFNYEKENLNAAYQESDESGSDAGAIQEALILDAKAFSELLDGQVSPEWLVNDYNKRG